MADSTTRSLPQHSIEEEEDSSSKIVSKPTDNIPIEIIPDEEMFLIEAAFASATRTFLPPLTQLQKNKGGRSITSISVLSKKRFSGVSGCGSIPVGDIEDSARDGIGQKKKKKIKSNETLLYQFRRKRGLAVTDLTATEWCEKQMEFILFRGKAKPTKAMKVGAARHAELEEEVVKKVPIQVTSAEDKWALRFINFIVGANQLLFEGLTRELPLVSFEKGLWIVGIIDEVRMPLSETETYATLVDTKTRVLARLPSAPQQRNGRLQLMCYKRLWDNLVADKFPSGKFFDFFVLNPHRILSSDIRECTAKSGFPAETLNDLVNFYLNSCRLLPPANTELLLRYELQEDQSLIGEDQFEYDGDWLDSQLTSCLEFWRGERDPHYAPEEERWKCRFCKFSSLCPVNADNGSLASTSSSTGARFVFSRHPVKERIRSLNCVGRNIGGTESDAVGDIEDSAHDWSCQRKKSKVNESLFDRFRRSRGLSVTDLTGTEWCEKQMEFVLCRGRPKPTKAMQAGSARHAELEEEVIKRVKIGATTAEDRWALKFANFIIGANQLLLKGLTRELPLVSFEKGVWMVGIIDEIRIPLTEAKRYATLVDTKTRAVPKPPAKPQQRIGRLQLMCYKRLWDNLVTSNFPSGKFFDFFTLNPHYVLPSEIKESMATYSITVEVKN